MFMVNNKTIIEPEDIDLEEEELDELEEIVIIDGKEV